MIDEKETNTKTIQTMIINHYQQPTGNSCGPTCLYIVLKHIKPLLFSFDKDPNNHELNIESICNMCGTDWEVGTPPDRMEKGMKLLDINYVEYLASPRPYELLRRIINDGNIPILRTITKGVPHWIIVEGYNFVNNHNFKIVDPWLGKFEYSEAELDVIWKQRQYQFFEVLVPKSDLVYAPYIPLNRIEEL